jgi:hypothetical protein
MRVSAWVGYHTPAFFFGIEEIKEKEREAGSFLG